MPIDTLESMAAEARKQASTDASKLPAGVTPEMRELAETRVHAAIAQKLVDAYKQETLDTGKPCVMVFQMLTPGADEPEVFAGVMLHVCRAGTPKHALELLARTLHSKLKATVAEAPEDS